MRGNWVRLLRSRAEAWFQFTPLHEKQPDEVTLPDFDALFQFTPLHERQRCSFRNAYQLYYFNSRLYMRGNLCVERTRTYRAISIHASTREATHFKGITGYPTLFQFTPLYERQHCTSVRAMPVSLFQFTPLHERQRQLVYPHQVEKGNFNSRLCMRGNPVSADIIHAAGVFQFTPLHERQQSATFIYAQSDSLFQFTPLLARQQN